MPPVAVLARIRRERNGVRCTPAALPQQLLLQSRELVKADRCTLFLVDKRAGTMSTTLEEGQSITFPVGQARP
jgi:hypothetical protein